MRITKYCLAGLMLLGGLTVVVGQEFNSTRRPIRARGPISSRTKRQAPQETTAAKRPVRKASKNLVHRFDDLFTKQAAVPTAAPTQAGPTAEQFGIRTPSPTKWNSPIPTRCAWMKLNQSQPQVQLHPNQSSPACLRQLLDQRSLFRRPAMPNCKQCPPNNV